MPHTRKRFPEQCLVISIEVPACQRAAVIAHDHTIRIQHRHHLQHHRSMWEKYTRQIWMYWLNDHGNMTDVSFSSLTLKTKVSRSSWASSESPSRKSRKPSIIQELLVSPGWTLAVTTTAFLARPSTLPTPRDVTVTTYTAFPARLWHSTRSVQYDATAGLEVMRLR